MKHIFKRNQIIIAALAVMIAAAGYLNYSGRLFQDKEKTTQTSAELASQELLDISEEDVETSSEDIESVDGEAKEDGSVEGTPGGSVDRREASAVVAEAKVTREQVRAQNKETLQEIIDNDTGYCINILDTPGHQDFSEDTYRTLMAADSAVMVIDASKGVEAQTRKLFKVCVMRHIPIFTFINKMDREARDTFELLDEIEKELGIATCPINWPIGSGKEFRGVYDRASKKVEIFSDTKKGTTQGEVKKVDINDPEISWLITDDQRVQLEEEIELQDGAGAEFDQELVSKGELSPVFLDPRLPTLEWRHSSSISFR